MANTRPTERRCPPSKDRGVLRAFRAAAMLLEQVAYPGVDATAADELSSCELSIAVTLLSGELFDGASAPGIG